MKYIGNNQIEISGEVYDLCACENCKEIHAIHEDAGTNANAYPLNMVDDKIKCCDNPNNWFGSFGINKSIKEFIKRLIMRKNGNR